MNRKEMKDLTIKKYENLIERVKTDSNSVLLLDETSGSSCLYCDKFSDNLCKKCPLKDKDAGDKYLKRKKIFPSGTVHCCGGRWLAMRKSINTINELQSLKNLLAYIKKHG
jgi:hypothetical protein